MGYIVKLNKIIFILGFVISFTVSGCSGDKQNNKSDSVTVKEIIYPNIKNENKKESRGSSQ